MVEKSALLLVGFAVCVVYFSGPVSAFRTCAEARYCCPGRNNTCFAHGPRMDNDNKQKRCFCDQECATMGDCCIDYTQTCTGRDCLMEEWGSWSECDELCGYGTQRRKRKILRHRQHGGKKCPVRHEKRACVGNQCFAVQSVEFRGKELSEVGKILPAEFGRWRTSSLYSMEHDIRRNLIENRLSNEVPTRLPYCAKFTIVATSLYCNMSGANNKWANELQLNRTVCIQCDPFAMSKELGTRCIGHGVYNHTTRWKAVDVPYCNGQWKMITKPQDGCVCDVESKDSFILI
ncbi:somatomedin-B and thrombospondin type-1 domain-containing protein-like [Saccostrea cucullata]|uniref:somatomedin-B and thrombospondin type-1 domain-containing protein-like n=1 Tax=Saccostrea cuccullata TaxID=36930 RepID=UPI002ED09879